MVDLTADPLIKSSNRLQILDAEFCFGFILHFIKIISNEKFIE